VRAMRFIRIGAAVTVVASVTLALSACGNPKPGDGAVTPSQPLTSEGPTGDPSSTFWDGKDLSSVPAETMPTEP
jgi:hypothetical protein